MPEGILLGFNTAAAMMPRGTGAERNQTIENAVADSIKLAVRTTRKRLDSSRTRNGTPTQFTHDTSKCKGKCVQNAKIKQTKRKQR
jgi:hypothetical protein